MPCVMDIENATRRGLPWQLVMTAVGLGALASALAEEVQDTARVASRFPCQEAEIAHYTAYRTTEPIKIDGS